MTEMIGNYSLSLAVLVAAIALLATIAAGRFASTKALVVAKLGIAAMAGLFTVASLALAYALVHNDFTLSYVGRFTERALPFGYKLAAFWAGQEGSLLLWAWLLAVLSTIAIFLPSKDASRGIGQSAITVAVLAIVCAFFAC